MFFGICLISLVFGLACGYLHGKFQADRGNPDAAATLRNTAINVTVVLTIGLLMFGPASGGALPWYKQTPAKPLYIAISSNLKPKDKKGRGWLPAQKFDRADARSAAWMYAQIHQGLTATACALLVGLLASFISRPLGDRLIRSTPPGRYF